MTDLAVHVLEPNRRLDAIDRKILTVLQEDASLSVAEIGDRVGLSSTPCWKRIQRLEADGVILRRVALVDQNKIGLGISVFVSVESADHSESWLRTFADAVSAMPEVMEFYRMAGDVDYMLRVVVADMQSYDVFYKKLISAVPLKNVTSRFAMEKIKSVTALPVPAAWFPESCPGHGAARSDATQSRDPRAPRDGSRFSGALFASLTLRHAPDTRPSDLLIVLADFGMGAQHRIHRLEHVAHALLGHRALDHHHQFRLVG